MKAFSFIFIVLTLCWVLTSIGCSNPVPTVGEEIASDEALTQSITITTTGEISTTGDVALATLNAILNSPPNLDGFVELTPEQLHELLPSHPFTLVNVHVPYQGELPDTDLFIPFTQIADHQAELPAKDRAIILYCKSGPMSAQAAKVLVSLGYTRVYELQGGFDAWAAASYEVLTKAQ
jgi:rhodanese-related sulfurtransferase